MSISDKELERVLPQDQQQQNQVLRKLVITLRQKLVESQEENKVLQTQLCATCRNQREPEQVDVHNDDQLKAAIERATVLQQDYNSLATHFDALRAGYKQILDHAEQLKCELEEQRQQNKNLVLLNQEQQSQLLLTQQLQQEVAFLKQVNSQLQKDNNQAMITAMESAKQLEKVKSELSGNKSVNVQLIQVQNEALKTQNEELRNQLMQIFEIASVDSISALNDEIVNLQQLLKEKDAQIKQLAVQITDLQAQQNGQLLQQRQALQLEAENQTQKIQQQTAQQLRDMQQQHLQEITSMQNKIKEIESECSQFQGLQKQAYESQQASERQLQTEKQTYQKAVERAKQRYVLLSEQIEGVSQQKDEYEARNTELTIQIAELQRQCIELKQQLRAQQSTNQEDIFLKAPVQPQIFQAIQQQTDVLQQNSADIAKAVMESLKQRQNLQQFGYQEVSKEEGKEEEKPVERYESSKDEEIHIEEDEIPILDQNGQKEDAAMLNISLNYSDMTTSENLPGKYCVQIKFDKNFYVSELSEIVNNTLEINFAEPLSFAVILNDYGSKLLSEEKLDICLKKQDENKLVEMEHQQLDLDQLLKKKQISQDLSFQIGIMSVSVEVEE